MANAKDLITRARAYQNLSGVSGVDTTIDSLVTVCSEAIEHYCRRDFYSRAYDELYNGNGERRMLLREYPIQSVKSVRYRPVTVIKITNNTAANVQARVNITSTGLSLFRSNAGSSSTDTSCTYAGNTTLTALVAAVNALSNGWNAQVVGDSVNYGGWPSADLYVAPSYGDGVQSQGGLSCVGGSFAEIKMHTFELQGFQWDPRGWLLRAIPYTDPELLHPEDLVFPVGINNFRIQYTAGYTTIPEAVQEAAAEWVAEMYFMTLRDPVLLHQVPGSGTTSGWGRLVGTNGQPPDNVRSLLAPYRRYTVATNQS
jgi:hypothetical protein